MGRVCAVAGKARFAGLPPRFWRRTAALRRAPDRAALRALKPDQPPADGNRVGGETLADGTRLRPGGFGHSRRTTAISDACAAVCSRRTERAPARLEKAHAACRFGTPAHRGRAR